MSQTGAISLCMNQPDMGTAEFLPRLLTACEVSKLFLVARAPVEASEWEEAIDFDAEPVESEYIDVENPTPDDLVQFFAPGTRLRISVNESPILNQVADAVEGVDPSVNEYFWVSSMILRVGDHDIFDMTDDDGKYLFKAFASVSFWGYGIPVQTDHARTVFSELPAVRELAEKLQTLFGDVRTVVTYWC